MANNRKRAAGPGYSRVLERQPHNGAPPEANGHAPTAAPAAPASPPPAAKKKGRDPKVNGHTIYFHDDKFELIMVEANRRKQTISEYVGWCLRNAPHHNLSVLKDTAADKKPDPQPDDQDNPPGLETDNQDNPPATPGDDQAGA